MFQEEILQEGIKVVIETVTTPMMIGELKSITFAEDTTAEGVLLVEHVVLTTDVPIVSNLAMQA